MLKKTISYVDLFGTKRTEEFYFHYSQSELLEMELSTEGGFTTRLQSVINANSPKELFAQMKQFILGAYGEKSEDGRQFMKSAEISHGFECCPAYDKLMQELCLGPDATEAATAFIKGIVPDDMPKADAPAAT